MSEFSVGIQCSSLGERCGIYTYSQRFEEYLNKEGIKTFMFKNKCKKKCDIISLQYEPGILPPNANPGQPSLRGFIDMFSQPIIATVHHTGMLPNFYGDIDGLIFHNENQIIGEPWNKVVIPHPALVYPEQDKKKLRKKYGIPLDKKVIGTAGFIAGTGKHLPEMTEFLLKDMKDDEFLYNITSFWKGGDFGFKGMIDEDVKRRGKEKNFKQDTEFVPANILNEKMQCCDLLFTWNESIGPGGTSGIAMDMIGAHRKVIVKDAPHYATPASIENVLVGRGEQDLFAEDVLNTLRNEDLSKIANPEPWSWDVLIKDVIEYMETWL